VGDRDCEDWGWRSAQAESLGDPIPFQPIKAGHRASEVTQVVKNLPSKCEALSSNPRTTKKKKKAGHGGTHL
jgi:hypothetical protein